MAFDSIINRNEYFSAHYLGSLLTDGLKAQRDAWKEHEDKGESTARTQVRNLSQPYFSHRAGAEDGDLDELRSMHDAALAALGFTSDRRPLDVLRGDQAHSVPVLAAHEISTGLLLVAIEATFALDVDEVLGKEGAARLVDPPAKAPGEAKQLKRVAELVGHLFAADEPPRYVLVLAGGIVVLADRSKWGEGKYLAVNLDDALGRRDAKPKGELETIAGLFSADVLVPVDGQSMLDGLVDASRKHAVGVSEDLRDGLRQSIELLANEVIYGRQKKHLGVYADAKDGIDPKDLTTQCLRYLYRIVFLLFAESRPELGILPVDAPEYSEGYGLDRLRELALVELKEERSRNGTHIQQSLSLLFELVNDGYRHTGAQIAAGFDGDVTHIGLVFEPLKSDLFARSATPLLNSIDLRNDVLRQVLELLMLSKPKKGRNREFVSYANLGINQLGAVYEGLMAFTGFFADEDLFEVAKNGDPHKGSWVVPVAKALEYPDEVFVKRADADGTPGRVLHKKGSFVFRLSGRARQRSASYYTPKVLTECVVRHSLAELLDQGDQTTPAEAILDLTVCEPALGSGAFLNEAIDQLAAEYLKRRQNEVGENLDPETYLVELQKVKAHLALHQCYGVDLNSTAVELAEVSLWLNAMYPGLQAPWFGLHLRRGNSLIGAHRATYKPSDLKKGAWLTKPPTDRKLCDGPIGDGEIHHFLLPAHGWGAVVDAKEAKELRPDEVERLKAWRKTLKEITPQQVERLQALARRVESLWESAGLMLGLAEKNLRRPIQVWKGPKPPNAGGASREDIERALTDPESSLGRLRLVMDAWCALWFWPVAGPDCTPTPPTVTEWVDTLEAILGTDPGDLPEGQLDLFADLDAILAREEQLALDFSMESTRLVRDGYPWLANAGAIRDSEGFFHWELEFASIFGHGAGFSLQVGNPPWVRPRWEDDVTLAEFEPWFGVAERPSEVDRRDRRQTVLRHEAQAYLSDLTSQRGQIAHLGSAVISPRLSGIQTNLYLLFIDGSLDRMARSGAVGLLHPEGHFSDPNAGEFRNRCYRHLRLHLQYANDLGLFEDVGTTREFGVCIYGGEQEAVRFRQISQLVSVQTADQSLIHDGDGVVPGLQYPGGGWDLRPHKSRVVVVDDLVLAEWVNLFDEPGTPPRNARLLRPVTTESQGALSVLGSQSTRLSDLDYCWVRGYDEDKAKRENLIVWNTSVPSALDGVVLQGPHISVALPLFKQPNPECRNKNDYSLWDLETLPERVIPRTNYQIVASQDVYLAGLPTWQGKPASDHWRVVWRRMTEVGTERSLQAALIPPGPTHVHTVGAMALTDSRSTALLGALFSSLPYDYLIKVSGKTDLFIDALRSLPWPNTDLMADSMCLRILRLCALTSDYEELWSNCYSDAWTRDRWASVGEAGLSNLGEVSRAWTWDSPLRNDRARRQALVELDALAALALGMSADHLASIYNSQFPVLRKYESAMAFDSAGRRLCGFHQAAGRHQAEVQARAKDGGLPPEWKSVWKQYERWDADNSSIDWADQFYPPFHRTDREAEMRTAYRVFAERYGITTP